ncbi:MAG: hypothetical protein COB15_16750 [Flavobacteriales bacterium]|nr:MAG: hypothetical protein COB15_16750 [Flavobacteriales bacterium]
MKKLYTLLTAVILTATAFAQAPEKMSYQAVVRDASDALVATQAVGMQISILQTTATGTAVYVETQTPTTNINGLVSIEIGSGTAVSGTFNTIDWSAGPYFIKTETDPTGGTTYTITGTSQLMSVPYALHSKTADSITGGITETDPTYTASQAANITSTDITNLSNLSGTNTGDQTISRTGTTVTLTNGGTFTDSVNTYTAGTGIDITNNVISASGTCGLSIGDTIQGGIIFYLDASGCHGLISATADQSTGIQWYNGINRSTGTTGNGLYAGSMNTAMIVATQMDDNQTGNFAAKVCADYSVTYGGVNYGDWYLPSAYELELLYLQRSVVGGFGTNFYWSSTEDSSANAWYLRFSNSYLYSWGKYDLLYVRAVRAF